MRDNKELIKSFIEEVFNKHDLTAIDKYLVANLTNGSGKKSKEPDYDRQRSTKRRAGRRNLENNHESNFLNSFTFTEDLFAGWMNAQTIFQFVVYRSYYTPEEIAELILNATKGRK